MLLIKPGLFSLDIIAKVRAQTNLPLGCYQVSGEYSMIKAAAEKGWIDEKKVFLESLLAMRRAGADFILTYAAKKCCQLLT
jgi:porphobilinogen synthase